MERLLDRLAALEDRHRELSLRVIDPEIIADPEAYRMAMRDYSELDPLVQRIRQYREADFALQAAREDARSEDVELRQMAAEEVARLEALQARWSHELQEALVPDDVPAASTPTAARPHRHGDRRGHCDDRRWHPKGNSERARARRA